MKQSLKFTSLFTISLTVAFILFMGIMVANGAWSEPLAPAPGGNVAAPINVSNVGQSKAGGIQLNRNGTADSIGLSVHVGKSLFGYPADQYPTDDSVVVEANGDIAARAVRIGVPNTPFDNLIFRGNLNSPPDPTECTNARRGNVFFNAFYGDIYICADVGGGNYAWNLNIAGQKLCVAGGAGSSNQNDIPADATGQLLSVPGSWTGQNCSDYVESRPGFSVYGLACLNANGIVWGERDNFGGGATSPPDPNCGWR